MFDKRVSNEVKGIAIILMLMHHLFGCLVTLCEQYGVNAAPFSWNNLYVFCLCAKVCVSMYVFITAYGTTISYDELSKQKVINRAEMGKFATNRYVKLIFNYGFIWILAMFTSFLRDASISEIYGAGKTGVMHAIIDATGLANYFGTPSLNETWWYMTLAILLIFTVPVLIRCYESCGILLVIIAGYFTYIGINDSTFTKYLFCIMMGIFFAKEKMFEKIKKVKIINNKIINIALKVIIYFIVITLLLWLRRKTNWSYWIDTFFAISVCCLCTELHEVRFGINRVMEYFGNHSMNIFLVHTLIFEYYFTDFIYGFKHWILILLALLLTSLATSIICEMFKKVLRLDKLISRINILINEKILRIKEFQNDTI